MWIATAVASTSTCARDDGLLSTGSGVKIRARLAAKTERESESFVHIRHVIASLPDDDPQCPAGYDPLQPEMKPTLPDPSLSPKTHNLPSTSSSTQVLTYEPSSQTPSTFPNFCERVMYASPLQRRYWFDDAHECVGLGWGEARKTFEGDEDFVGVRQLPGKDRFIYCVAERDLT
jgi:hypothetical protein